MNDDRNKVIKQLTDYLKFYKDYNDYPIYKSELDNENPDFESSQLVSPESNIEDEGKNDMTIVADENSTPVKEIKKDHPSLIREDWMNCTTLQSFGNEISNCPKCKLLARTRKHVVFGTGNPNADIVVVGEAPGADEDEQGKPFVGRAGRLLTDILKAINLSREEVFICNILKCRPPENRNPLPDEISNCEPYLFKQLEMIKPKLILAVGTFAAQTLLKTKEPLGRLRGRFHLYKGVRMMVTYHPAALLRNPNWKKPTWEDVQLFRKEYDKQLSATK